MNINSQIKIGKLYQYPFSVNLRKSPDVDFNIKRLMKAYTPFVALELSHSAENYLWLKILSPDGDTSYVLCSPRYLKEAR